MLGSRIFYQKARFEERNRGEDPPDQHVTREVLAPRSGDAPPGVCPLGVMHGKKIGAVTVDVKNVNRAAFGPAE